MTRMQSLRGLPVVFLLLASLILVNLVPVWANTDTTGGSANVGLRGSSPVYGFPITITASGTLQSIGVNWADTTAGNVRVALYTPGSNKPASLLVDSGTVPITTTAGWQDVSVSAVSVTAGNYWVAIQISVAKNVYTTAASRSYYYLAGGFGPFDSTWSATSNQDSQDQWNMRVTYSTGPPPPPPSDFTISASQPSQTVGASSTASYTLNIQYSSTLSTTVNLAITAGCPTGVTCAVSPNSITGSTSVTLSVPTLLTTPSGTTSVTVTASSTSPVLSHTVTVQLTVNGPASFPITVHSGATQVVVTISWTGTGTAPVTLVGPGGSPTLSESGAAVYDRTSIPTGSSTPTYIHRVTFTLSPSPPSTQTWTVLISIAVPSGYTVTIEVS